MVSRPVILFSESVREELRTLLDHSRLQQRIQCFNGQVLSLSTKARNSSRLQFVSHLSCSVLQNRFVLMVGLGFLWKEDRTPAKGPVILSAGCQAFRIS